MSSFLTAKCLYALAQSNFTRRHLRPALSRTESHFCVEDIVVGNSSLSMPSLTLLPLGADRFKMIHADPLGFCLHIMPFTFELAGLLDGWNGPLANPDTNQSATASVTCSANSRVLAALRLTVGWRAAPLQPMSAPMVKSVHTLLTDFCPGSLEPKQDFSV
jgi:hypothetical protein